MCFVPRVRPPARTHARTHIRTRARTHTHTLTILHILPFVQLGLMACCAVIFVLLNKLLLYRVFGWFTRDGEMLFIGVCVKGTVCGCICVRHTKCRQCACMAHLSLFLTLSMSICPWTCLCLVLAVTSACACVCVCVCVCVCIPARSRNHAIQRCEL